MVGVTKPRFLVLKARVHAGVFSGCERPAEDTGDHSLSGALSTFLTASEREPEATFGLFEQESGGSYVNRGWIKNGRAV